MCPCYHAYRYFTYILFIWQCQFAINSDIKKAWRYKTGKQTPQKQRTTNNTMNQKEQKDNHDLQNTSSKTKVWAERIPLKTGHELM